MPLSLADSLLLMMLLVAVAMALYEHPALQTPKTAQDAPTTRSPTGAMPPLPQPSSIVPWLPRAADLLVVDDSAVARTKLSWLLESAGYTVHLARDGVEALALLEKGRYGLMLTDLEMPNIDGIDLIAKCRGRSSTRRLPIIAISSHANLRAKFDQCSEIAGVHPKPWVDDILLGHIGTIVPARVAPAEAALAA